MNKLAKIGAVSFVTWGLIHILGGASILAALGQSVEAAFATYRNSGGDYNEIAGSIIGYFAYLLVAAGVLVAGIGATLNWHNDRAGLAINTAIIAMIEAGLIWYLVLPGFVSWAEASIGLVPFAVAAAASGIACRATHA